MNEEHSQQPLSRKERKKLNRQLHKQERAQERKKNGRTQTFKRIGWIFVVLAVVSGIAWFISIQESVPKGERWTHGQVHWHANIAITTCGSYRSLDDIGSTTRHVGNALLHTHGDNLYHLEGQPLYVSDTTLGVFFDAIGVPFSDTKIFEYKNGKQCSNGTNGTLKVSVNGNLIENATKYAPKDKDSVAILFG